MLHANRRFAPIVRRAKWQETTSDNKSTLALTHSTQRAFRDSSIVHLAIGPSTEEGHKGRERICSIAFVADGLTFAMMVHV